MNLVLAETLNYIRHRKFLIIFFLFIFWAASYLFLPLNITEENASFEIAEGSNINEITEQLVEIKVLKESFRFKLLTFIFSERENLKKYYLCG